MSEPDGPDAIPALPPEPAPGAEVVEAPPRRLARFGIRRFIHRPRTRRGFFALVLVVAGLAAGAAFGTMSAISWTDTASFCGRCHQMDSELAAYDAGPHRDVACAECHVEPGIGGWVKAKLNGTRQLIEVLTGTYPQPVPPPDHSDLPAASETCLSCHSLGRLATTTVVTRTQYTADEANTPQFVALMIRPAGGDPLDVQRSVHWHVLQTVDYASDDPAAQTIDWVQVTEADGTVEQFIASDQVTVSDNVTPDIERLQQADRIRQMDCLDCHNRVGHPLPNPRREVDLAMSEGKIDATLPDIKRQAMSILTGSYPSYAAADAAVATLRDFYRLRYPDVSSAQGGAIDQAVEEIQLIYRLAATPEMKVTASTYPDNLGHTDFPGCFRCHDGAHFKVVDGALTSEAIPFRCDTCHTFPQIGAVTSLPMGEAPATHDDGLWVFNHKDVAVSADPGGTACGACHAQDYCVNCHQTGAVQVSHDDMLVNHAKVTADVGAAACAYCHQPAYCARCHAEPVLPGSNAGPGTSQEEGMRWPLVVASVAGG
jgi:nitrate/TMAO reductase-like tetraheme cytochrome c subunit